MRYALCALRHVPYAFPSSVILRLDRGIQPFVFPYSIFWLLAPDFQPSSFLYSIYYFLTIGGKIVSHNSQQRPLFLHRFLCINTYIFRHIYPTFPFSAQFIFN
jgi:hypothetical protein